jgi:hypothetical protein
MQVLDLLLRDIDLLEAPGDLLVGQVPPFLPLGDEVRSSSNSSSGVSSADSTAAFSVTLSFLSRR